MHRSLIKVAVLTLAVILSFALLVGCTQFSNNSGFNIDQNANNNSSLSSLTTKENTQPQNMSNNASSTDYAIGYLGYIEMGYYPQTVADRKAVAQMSKVTDSTGYYYSTYDNEHYEKVSIPNLASLTQNTYEFSTQDKIESNKTYYFKVEKIRWDVYGRVNVSNAKINLFLVSHVILDSSAYQKSYDLNSNSNTYEIKNSDGSFTGIAANSWEHSTLREFLNTTFYNKAFSNEEKEIIVAQDTNTANISDNVSILSGSDIVQWGNTTAQVSDYARVRNTFMDTNRTYYGNGRYWLKDQIEDINYSYRAMYVGSNNTKANLGESVGAEYIGIRSTLIISAATSINILTDSDEKKS